MSDQLYEMLAIGLRYWFVLLGALIVARTFLWLHRDRKEKHDRVRRLPDAGSIGEVVVLLGPASLPEGSVMALPHEGVLGSTRSADIWVPSEAVAKEHLDFRFQTGVGLLVRPRRGCVCRLDGRELTRKNAAQSPPINHGSVLEVGDVVLKFRFFAGVDAGAAPDDRIQLYQQERGLPNAPGGYAPDAPGAASQDWPDGYPSTPPGASAPPVYPPLREPPAPPAYREEEGDWHRSAPNTPWTPK